MKIVGFDPGYGLLGWAYLEVQKGAMEIHRDGRIGICTQVDYGVISTEATSPMEERLLLIQNEVNDLLADKIPDAVVVETLYVNRNLKTVAGVYQSRGILLAAVARSGAKLLEVNPGQIKSMITGHGRATKKEVTLMVQRLLGIEKPIRPDDAADALAGALSGAFIMRSQMPGIAGPAGTARA